MIKLFAVIFLLTNGVMGQSPEDILTYNVRTFDTVEACQAFIVAEQFRETDAGLKLVVANVYGPDARIVYECSEKVAYEIK